MATTQGMFRLDSLVMRDQPAQDQPHPFAKEMALYAQDAAETVEPWKRWQFKHAHTKEWQDIGNHPSWINGYIYRRKLKTIRIGEFDVPAPETKEPAMRTLYYIPNITYGDIGTTTWQNTSWDKRVLERGLVHLIKEHAEIHTNALLSFTDGSKA